MSGDHNKHAFEGMTIDASEPIKTKFPDWPESAFPSTFQSLNPEPHQVHRWGMTLRDYFAAKAMQGMVSRFEANEGLLAAISYKVADAMLRARKK